MGLKGREQRMKKLMKIKIIRFKKQLQKTKILKMMCNSQANRKKSRFRKISSNSHLRINNL